MTSAEVRPTYPQQAKRLPAELQGSRRGQCRTNSWRSSGQDESTWSLAPGALCKLQRTCGHCWGPHVLQSRYDVFHARPKKQALRLQTDLSQGKQGNERNLCPGHPTTSTSLSSLDGPGRGHSPAHGCAKQLSFSGCGSARRHCFMTCWEASGEAEVVQLQVPVDEAVSMNFTSRQQDLLKQPDLVTSPKAQQLESYPTGYESSTLSTPALRLAANAEVPLT